MIDSILHLIVLVIEFYAAAFIFITIVDSSREIINDSKEEKG